VLQSTTMIRRATAGHAVNFFGSWQVAVAKDVAWPLRERDFECEKSARFFTCIGELTTP
jgi:hypothetical protein